MSSATTMCFNSQRFDWNISYVETPAFWVQPATVGLESSTSLAFPQKASYFSLSSSFFQPKISPANPVNSSREKEISLHNHLAHGEQLKRGGSRSAFHPPLSRSSPKGPAPCPFHTFQTRFPNLFHSDKSGCAAMKLPYFASSSATRSSQSGERRSKAYPLSVNSFKTNPSRATRLGKGCSTLPRRRRRSFSLSPLRSHCKRRPTVVFLQLVSAPCSSSISRNSRCFLMASINAVEPSRP